MLDVMTSAQGATRARFHQLHPDVICKFVVRIVARDFGLDPAALWRTTRGTPEAAFARQVAIYLAHVSFALNYVTVGRAFGRDRTTVAHACRRVEDRRDEPFFDKRLIVLEAACRVTAAGYAA